MPETLQPRATLAEVFQRLGSIDTQLALIAATTASLDKAINGNGRPGLIEDHRVLQHLVEGHLEQAKMDADARKTLARETKEAKELLATEAKTSRDMLAKDVKERREKISGRMWAVILLIISVFVTNAAGLIVLFIRTGGIH